MLSDVFFCIVFFVLRWFVEFEKHFYGHVEMTGKFEGG